jgi:hypothetical protein
MYPIIVYTLNTEAYPDCYWQAIGHFATLAHAIADVPQLADQAMLMIARDGEQLAIRRDGIWKCSSKASDDERAQFETLSQY